MGPMGEKRGTWLLKPASAPIQVRAEARGQRIIFPDCAGGAAPAGNHQENHGIEADWVGKGALKRRATRPPSRNSRRATETAAGRHHPRRSMVRWQQTALRTAAGSMILWLPRFFRGARGAVCLRGTQTVHASRAPLARFKRVKERQLNRRARRGRWGENVSREIAPIVQTNEKGIGFRGIAAIGFRAIPKSASGADLVIDNGRTGAGWIQAPVSAEGGPVGSRNLGERAGRELGGARLDLRRNRVVFRFSRSRVRWSGRFHTGG